MEEAEPLSVLASVTNDEVVLRRLVARAHSPVDPDALRVASAELLGAAMSLSPLPLLYRGSGLCAASAPAFVIAWPGRDVRAVVELDESLARELIDRVLGGDGHNTVRVAAGSLSETEQGVLGFALAHLLAESTPWKLERVVGDQDTLGEVLDAGSAAVLPIQVHIGDNTGHARVSLSLQAARALPKAPVGAHLDSLPVPVVFDIGRLVITSTDLVSLVPGDALTLDTFWGETCDRPQACVARLLTNEAIVAVCRQSTQGLVVHSMEHGSGAPRHTEPRVKRGARMNNDSANTVTSLQDIPVEIAVEIARTQIPLGELSALKAGEILLTGQPLHGRVTLRSAGRTVATGELVQIDGEIAVRLTSLGTHEL